MLPAHDEVIQRLKSFAERCPYVVASWVEGSVADGTADENSDVDVFVAVTGESPSDVATEIAAHIGEAVLCRRFYAGGPACSVLLTSGVDVDLFVRPAAQTLHTTLAPLVLYDPDGRLSIQVGARRADLDQAKRRVDDFWYFAYYYQKKALARKQLFYASYGLEVMRQSLLDLFRLLNKQPQWLGFKYKHVEDELNEDQL